MPAPKKEMTLERARQMGRDAFHSGVEVSNPFTYLNFDAPEDDSEFSNQWDEGFAEEEECVLEDNAGTGFGLDLDDDEVLADADGIDDSQFVMDYG